MNTFEVYTPNGKVWLTGATKRKTLKGIKSYLKSTSIAIVKGCRIKLIISEDV